MNFFKRNRNNTPTNDFREFVRKQAVRSEFADYIADDNSLLSEKLKFDTANPRSKVFGWHESLVRKYLIDCYIAYMGGEAVTLDEHQTIRAIKTLPIGTELRRVLPQEKGNEWAVRYRKGVTRYGRTIVEAVTTLYAKDIILKKRGRK